MPTQTELKMLQSLPLEVKIQKTRLRIQEFAEEFGEDCVYAAFSGGKDSTVLLHILRQMYPGLPAVFADTGLEYQGLRQFVKHYEHVTWVKPEITFKEVVIQYGYPVIGKEVASYVWVARHAKEGPYKQGRLERLEGTNRRKDGNLSIYNRPKYRFLLDAPFELSDICCREMKKKPMHRFSRRTGKYPIIATMAEESQLRKGKWLKSGCNSFQSKEPNSTPMAFWREQDILRYLYQYHDEILETIYDGYRNQGWPEEEIRKLDLKHPWADCYGEIEPYIKKNEVKGQISFHEYLGEYTDCKFRTTKCRRTGCIYCLFGITQDRDRMLQVQREEPKIADYVLRGGMFNERGMWQPDQRGLGFWFVIEWLNVHGNLSIVFEGKKEYEEQYGNERTRSLLCPVFREITSI